MKKRLDVIITEKGLVKSREKAKAIIMAGNVYIGGQKADKCGSLYDENVSVEVRDRGLKYVSRGGYKLEKAIREFSIVLTGLCAMDIGASTGGFTDCMLKNGVCKIYAVDVGYGQLDWRLRTDSRVVNLERTNMRYVTSEQITHDIDFFSMDVSFISIRLLLPSVKKLLVKNGRGVCLIKPQFEAGKAHVGKNGVVRDRGVHVQVIEDIVKFCLESGFSVLNLDYSPVKGPKGNIEYLIYIEKSDTPVLGLGIDILSTVKTSHTKLNGDEES